MTGRVFGVEVLDELRGIWREPTALFFSIVMPVAFFALFVSLFGNQPGGGTAPGAAMLATFGTYGAVAVALMNPGIGVAEDRNRGWLRAKQVSAVPLGVTIAAKVAAALPYALGVLVAMAVAATLLAGLDASALTLLRLFGVVVLGSLPFALFGLAVGFQANSNATTAILNAILMPAAVVSGLWMPLEIMPDVFARIAMFLPTYHLGQLALAQIGGGGWLDHTLVVLATTAVTAVLAVVSYRHAHT